VSQFLFAILLIGFIALSAARQIGRRRTVTPKTTPDIRLDQRPEHVFDRNPPEVIRTEEAEPADFPVETPSSAGSHRYLLSHCSSNDDDRMATAMDMMSGPGICVPHGRKTA
jgi:hypothetical protein